MTPRLLSNSTPIAPAKTASAGTAAGMAAPGLVLNTESFSLEHIYEPTSGEAVDHHPVDHLLCLSLINCPVQLTQIHDQRMDRGIHRKGDIVLLPAGTTKWQWQGEDRYLYVRLAQAFFEQVALETLDTDPSRIQPNYAFQLRDPQIQQLGMMLLSELQQGVANGRLYTESLMNVLAVHLLRNHSTLAPKVSLYADGLPEYQLAQVLDYLQTYLNREIKLADLAGLLEMSQFHFARRFKQSMGMSPHQYLLGQRVERARQLLKASDLPIAEIALQCGFNSQSHLGKAFRELTGVTPSVYRKR